MGRVLATIMAIVGMSTNAGAQVPSRAALAGKLTPCSIQGARPEGLCGHLDVREQRARPSSRTIALNVMVLPATTDSVLPDPLVFLAGGGVAPATRYAGFLTRAFARLRRTHDILLVDQRGTWNSNPLACSPPGGPPSSPAALNSLRQCRDSLSATSDLTAYTTLAAVEDLDAVRAWLGYSTVDMYGVSYGTKVAQVYVKRYPEHVRSVVLYGVVPVSKPSQLDLARFAQTSLDTVFARCAADEQCRSAFPHVRAEFDSVLARLTRAPASATVDGPNGPMQLPIGDRVFRDVIQAMLGSAQGSSVIPALVHHSFAGDYSDVARSLLGTGPPPPPPPPRGVFFSILCSEAIPQFTAADVAGATSGTFFGDAPVRSQMASCDGWPRAELPRDFWQPTRADVPVLAVAGDLDPITPPAYAAAALAAWRNSRIVVVPNRSHNDVDPCITGMFEEFLMAGGRASVDTSCAVRPNPLRFVLPDSSRGGGAMRER